MAEMENDNVSAAGLEPTKVKGHSEQFFGGSANEESTTSHFSLQEGMQGEVTSTETLTSTPEFIAQNGEVVQKTTSASDGWYQFTGLSSGQTYIVAPIYPCEYSFRPAEEVIVINSQDVLNVNFSAQKLLFSIYGNVSSDGVGIANVVITLHGGNDSIYVAMTDTDGNYIINGLENGIYNIEISESWCLPENGLTTIMLWCENKEVNFVCRKWALEQKEEEKAVITKEVEKLKATNSPLDQSHTRSNACNVIAIAPLEHRQMKQSSTIQSTSTIEPTSDVETTHIAESTPTYYFYHWDHLGTVKLITDNSGNIVSRHDFEPYGVEIPPYNETASNTHKYTGQERDASTGLDYMHFRYYGSNIGRFMKPDNVIGSPLNPQNWNLYSYVQNNPVNYNDPTGMIVNLSGLSSLKEAFMDQVSEAIGVPVYQDDSGNLTRAQGPPTSANTEAMAAFDEATRQSTPEITMNLTESSNVAIDQFSTKTVDVGQLAAVPAKAPTEKPEATTRGELITHIFKEYAYSAINNSGFREAHEAATTAQNKYRAARGQTSLKGPGAWSDPRYEFWHGNPFNPHNWFPPQGWTLTLPYASGARTRIIVINGEVEVVNQ